MNKKKKIPCIMCDEVFPKASKLNDHMKSIHKQTTAFNCLKCSYTGASIRAVQNHIRNSCHGSRQSNDVFNHGAEQSNNYLLDHNAEQSNNDLLDQNAGQSNNDLTDHGTGHSNSDYNEPIMIDEEEHEEIYYIQSLIDNREKTGISNAWIFLSMESLEIALWSKN